MLAYAGYGVNNVFRQRLRDLGLSYVVGIVSAVVVWPPGVEPLPPKPYSGFGRPPVMPRRTRGRQPLSVKALTHTLPADAYRRIAWREGTTETLRGRFAAVRVRHAGGKIGRARLREPLWLLIESPADDAGPLKCCLSNLPADTTLEGLVRCAHMRWRIERDYQVEKRLMRASLSGNLIITQIGTQEKWRTIETLNRSDPRSMDPSCWSRSIGQRSEMR